MVLGVRDNQTDFLYGDFLLNFFKQSGQSKLILACSRQIEDLIVPDNVHMQKGYVQSVVKEDPMVGDVKLSKCMAEMLADPTTLIQICGNKSSMGKESIEALKDIGVFENDNAIETMKASGHLLMELWGE